MYDVMHTMPLNIIAWFYITYEIGAILIKISIRYVDSLQLIVVVKHQICKFCRTFKDMINCSKLDFFLRILVWAL